MSQKSKSKEYLSELKTTSKKHKNIDFVEMNDIMVELFEKVITNINGELTNSLTKELIETVKNMGKK